MTGDEGHAGPPPPSDVRLDLTRAVPGGDGA